MSPPSKRLLRRAHCGGEHLRRHPHRRSVDPNAPAIQFIANASPDDTPIVITHGQFVARVTQTANALHELGVGPNDVVSFMLPLIPQAFFTLFGAEAAGIYNPVNPLLEPHQIAEILEAANTKVLVALGPTPAPTYGRRCRRFAAT